MAPTDTGVSTAPNATHTNVYRRPDEFCSWPFNTGLWHVGPDEVLVSFVKHDCDYAVESELSHGRVETYGEIYSMRTTNGGESWEADGVIADNVATSDAVQYGPKKTLEGRDFTDRETILTCWSAPNSGDPAATAWIKASDDGGRTWSPPVKLPERIFPRIQGRPSYVVRDDGALLLLLTGKSASDPHDRPIAYVSFDGGANWTFLSYIAGSEDYRIICPSPVRLDDGTLLAAVRCKPSTRANWVEVYASGDGGRNWTYRSRVNDQGEPGHLIRLDDGRLCCVYGYRHPPFGVRARFSDDGGQSWGREWILRDDGGNYDLGYPRATQLADGSVLAVYYFNTDEDDLPVEGGVRHVAATKFDPPE